VTKPDRNVTAGTTDSSYPSGTPEALARKQNRPQNGTELLPDRLAEIRGMLSEEERRDEIRARLDCGGPVLSIDVRWLLDEVERLTARVRMYEEVKS
jgi:hypothetical protein